MPDWCRSVAAVALLVMPGELTGTSTPPGRSIV